VQEKISIVNKSVNNLFENYFESVTDAALSLSHTPNYFFSNSISEKKMVEKQKKLLDDAICGNQLRELSLLKLPLQYSPCNILDIGGGIGWPFIFIKSRFKFFQYFNYELETAVDYYSKYWTDSIGPKFVSNYKDIKCEIDVIYSSSSLQYHESNLLLEEIVAYFKPEQIILDNLVSTNDKEFFCFQNHYDNKLIYRFLNLPNLIRDIEILDYKLQLIEDTILLDNSPDFVRNLNFKNSAKEDVQVNFPKNLQFSKI
jgi:putative methyltransferase (TIGR04325 family)